MPFSSVIDVRLALTPGAKKVDNETAAGFVDAQLADAILEADGIIKSYLARYYTIDTTETQQIDPSLPANSQPVNVEVAAYPVRGWSRDIAAYLATLTFFRNKDVKEDDPVRLRYGLAMANLDLVRKREIILDSEDFPPVDNADSQSGVFVENTYEGKLFHPEDFRLVPEGFSTPQVLWPYEQY